MSVAEPTPWPDQAPPLPAAAAVDPAVAVSPLRAKNPLLAAFLALFPGIGHVYNGLYLRGVCFFLLAASLMQITSRGSDMMGFAVAFVWLFNVLDAYRQATLINYGLAQDLGLTDRPRRAGTLHEGLAAGVLFFVIGLIALLDRFFAIDFELLFSAWPVVLMALGAWLVWGAVRDERRADR